MEPTFFALLGPFHYFLILLALVAYLPSFFLFRKWLKERRSLYAFASFAAFIFAALVSACLRTVAFPGGGLYDARYESDRHMIARYQDEIEAFKNACGVYPIRPGHSGNPGESSKNECSKYELKLPYSLKEIEYDSDGKFYRIVSKHRYSIKGLYVEGTNENRARLLIRNGK